MPESDAPAPAPSVTVDAVLNAAVEAVGGTSRPGQVQMAHAVSAALESDEHLVVEAGTGTGKSLGYLVPALLHDDRVVIATATLALQHQLVSRDIPALLTAAGDVLGKEPSYAVLKGRSNYACLQRVHEGVPEEPDDGGLFGAATTAPVSDVAAQVVALREWAVAEQESQGSGERDVAPAHGDKAWSQVSVSARECLGRSACPFGDVCFVEKNRDLAQKADIVVTNHSLLAIETLESHPIIPDFDAVIIDEAHEFTSRVTQSVTEELSPTQIERAARRVRGFVDVEVMEALVTAGGGLREVLYDVREGWLVSRHEVLQSQLEAVRDAARAVLSGFPDRDAAARDGLDAAFMRAKGAVELVHRVASRMCDADEFEVLWHSLYSSGGSYLAVAPLNVSAALRSKLFEEKTVVLTSATLQLGGDFTAFAQSVGLDPAERVEDTDVPGAHSQEAVISGSVPWRGLDVGSPFDYRTQSMLYVASSLTPPGRDGIGVDACEHLVELVEAAGGRTLGLFSSRRAADAAAAFVRTRLPHIKVLAQGDAPLPQLAAQFVADPSTCLFGTLGLWQGLDVPGDTCTLVVIDRIPFPRPDDPLAQARARAADRAGRNGFMSVSATHAALLLAQGTGRLIRRTTDRGVVAVLDPRLATARYGGFLRASLPDMWATTDSSVALRALRRLSESGS